MVTLHVHFFNGRCADYNVDQGWHWSDDGTRLIIQRAGGSGLLYGGVLRIELPAFNIQHIQVERHS